MEHVRTVTREFATGDNAVLHLESRSGSVLVEGRATASVTVEATLHIWTDIAAEADDAASLVAGNMEQDGHRVIVRAPALSGESGLAFGIAGGKDTPDGRIHFRGWIPGLRSSRIDYVVRVPARTAVRVLSRSGAVQISHTQGVVHTEAMSGRLGIEDVRGDVNAVSRSGAMLIERVVGDLIVDGRSGKVRIKGIEGRATIEVRSGALEVEDVGSDVRLLSRAGSVNVANVRGKLYVRTRAGTMRYRGRVCDDMDIEAHAGSITLAVDPDAPFFVDAESQVGSVRSDLAPRRNGGTAAAGGPRVKLRSRAGSIRLTRDG
jgi:hypothetical protein